MEMLGHGRGGHFVSGILSHRQVFKALGFSSPADGPGRWSLYLTGRGHQGQAVLEGGSVPGRQGPRCEPSSQFAEGRPGPF